MAGARISTLEQRERELEAKLAADPVSQPFHPAKVRFEAVLRREGVPRQADIARPGVVMMAFGLMCSEVSAEHIGAASVMAPPRVGRYYEQLVRTMTRGQYDAEETCRLHSIFCGQWSRSGYPVVRLSAKLGAALMLTDVDHEPTPWPAWVVSMPDGLLDVAGAPVTHLYVGCGGGGSVGLIGKAGIFWKAPPHTVELAMALVAGLQSALAANTHVDREGYRGRSSRRRNRGYREAPPPGTAYVVRAPVSIDLRATVREMAQGTYGSGGRPKVQFVVRGHWRNQAHGPKRSLRRKQWIEPFWKGPRDVRAAIRAYSLAGQNVDQSVTVSRQKCHPE